MFDLPYMKLLLSKHLLKGHFFKNGITTTGRFQALNEDQIQSSE